MDARLPFANPTNFHVVLSRPIGCYVGLAGTVGVGERYRYFMRHVPPLPWIMGRFMHPQSPNKTPKKIWRDS